MADSPKFPEEVSKALEWWKRTYNRSIPKIVSLHVAHPNHTDTPAFWQSTSKTIFLQPKFWEASHYAVQTWCLFHELAHYLLGHGVRTGIGVKERAAIEKGNQAFRRYFSNNPEILTRFENAMAHTKELKDTDF